MDEIWRWSATEVARAVAQREISSREAVEASLTRLDQVEPLINAFGDLADGALDRADAADAAVARGDRLGPLHGVPIGLKESHAVAGRTTLLGVPAFAGMAAESESCPPASRLFEAGAIEIGRTRMPPGGFRWSTESETSGITRNPWDPTVTAGGSSGGAAAAVATGVVPLVLGNDIGGSIRYPASVCGVVGLRPTVGKVPTSSEGIGARLSTREFFAEGPLARHIDDLRLALSVLAQHDPRDPTATPSATAERVSHPRIGVVLDPGAFPFAAKSQPEVDVAVRAAADRLAAEGYDVVEVDAPMLGEAASLWWKLVMPDLDGMGFGAQIDQFAGAGMSTKWHNMLNLVRDAYGDTTLPEYLDGYAQRALLRRELSLLMQEYPVLLVAGSGEPPFTLGDDIASPERTHELMCHQWPNLAVPALGLPAVGLATQPRPGKAPLGVQLIGRAFAEETVLDVAEVLHAGSGITTPVDPRPLPE